MHLKLWSPEPHRFYTLGGDPIFHDLWRNDQEVWAEPQYQTELLTKEASSFIGKQNASQPFFLYLAYGAPHYPMMAPEKYLQRSPATMDRDRRLHAAMVASLDDAVGQVREALRAKGLDRNTCIFFMSDNGATHEVRADHKARPYEGGSNRPYRGWKGSLFEGGIRIPAIMTWPGMLRPRVVDAPGAAMHIAPTFLGMGGRGGGEWLGRERSFQSTKGRDCMANHKYFGITTGRPPFSQGSGSTLPATAKLSACRSLRPGGYPTCPSTGANNTTLLKATLR